MNKMTLCHRMTTALQACSPTDIITYVFIMVIINIKKRMYIRILQNTAYKGLRKKRSLAPLQLYA